MTTAYDQFEMKESYEPSLPEATAIPKSLAAFLASRGLEAKSINARPDHMPKYRMRGFSPVQFSALPPDVQKDVRPSYEPPERNNDELRLGDAILVFRSVGAGKYWEDAEKARATAVMGQTSIAEEEMVAGEINARARQTLGRSALIVEATELSRRPAADHVMGGRSDASTSEFSTEMLDEIKRRREEIPD